MRRWSIVAAGFAAASLLVGAAWWLAPATPEPQPPSQGVSAARGRAQRPPPRMKKVAKLAPRPRLALGARRPAPPEKEPQLEPDERAEARQEFREERLQDISDRLDLHAEDAGWDEDQTEHVRVLLVDTADHISRRLAAVDRGDADWEQVKGELRQYRLDQAAKVRRALGDEEFEPFVDAMDFARFLGNEPIRGRLD